MTGCSGSRQCKYKECGVVSKYRRCLAGLAMAKIANDGYQREVERHCKISIEAKASGWMPRSETVLVGVLGKILAKRQAQIRQGFN